MVTDRSMDATIPKYPWFGIVEGDEIEQGDIFEDCPIFLPPQDLKVSDTQPQRDVPFSWLKRDVIVISQSCDLVKDREKIQDLLLCAVWKSSDLAKDSHLAKPSAMEDLRKGRYPAFHMLAASNLPGFEREVRIVDFRKIHTLPLPYTRATAALTKHLRLLPPYREHLSQSFARFFMRVGLPIDIPSFTKGKK